MFDKYTSKSIQFGLGVSPGICVSFSSFNERLNDSQNQAKGKAHSDAGSASTKNPNEKGAGEQLTREGLPHLSHTGGIAPCPGAEPVGEAWTHSRLPPKPGGAAAGLRLTPQTELAQGAGFPAPLPSPATPCVPGTGRREQDTVSNPDRGSLP